MPFVLEPFYTPSSSSDPLEKKKISSQPSSQQVVNALESYFQETALTQQMPLPRWAIW